MRRIRVAVVEDDARLRRTVERVLGKAEACAVVGMCGTAKEAIEQIPALAPHVILMDVNLPDGSGVDCVAALSPLLPDAQILMLTAYQDPETIFQAILAGAHGYLVKPVMPQRLVDAVREIREGGVPMSRAIARKVIQALRETQSRVPTEKVAVAEPAAAMEAPLSRPGDVKLAPREQQVLGLLVEGYSYKEAAVALGISVPTVGVYVNRIYEKLHISCRREMVAWAKRGG